jgi:hypothetical protein
MAWNNNKSGLPKLQGLPGLKKLPEYSDKNLNATLPLPGAPAPMSTDRLASPASLATPRRPAIPSAPTQHPELSPRAQKFRRLASILGQKK